MTPITIIANEFVNFINKAPENWIHLLNDIYDTDKKFGYYHQEQRARTWSTGLISSSSGP